MRSTITRCYGTIRQRTPVLTLALFPPCQPSIAPIYSHSRSLRPQVLMHIWDCTSDSADVDCNVKVDEVLTAAGLPIVKDCNMLHNVTVGDTKALARREGVAGLLLPIHASGLCTADNYDESIECWGTRSPFAMERMLEEEGEEEKNLQALFTYSCWTDGSYKEVPVDRMMTYLDGVSSRVRSAVSESLRDSERERSGHQQSELGGRVVLCDERANCAFRDGRSSATRSRIERSEAVVQRESLANRAF